MRKIKIFLITIFLLGSVKGLMADQKLFQTSATVPSSTSVSITVSGVTGNSSPSISGTAVTFNPITLNTTTQTFTPGQFFSVNVAPAAGTTSAVISYIEGANPNNVSGGSGHGLGWKSVASFMKVVGKNETALANHPKKLLKDLISTPEAIATSELGAGYFRLYVTTETNPIPSGDPAGAEFFSGNDKPGPYTGSVVVTGTTF